MDTASTNTVKSSAALKTQLVPILNAAGRAEQVQVSDHKGVFLSIMVTGSESHDFFLARLLPNSYFTNPVSMLEQTAPHASRPGGEAEAKGLMVHSFSQYHKQGPNAAVRYKVRIGLVISVEL